MKALRKIQRDAYLVSRTSGDQNAAQRGGIPRLTKRVIRRQLTRRAFALFGNGTHR